MQDTITECEVCERRARLWKRIVFVGIVMIQGACTVCLLDRTHGRIYIFVFVFVLFVGGRTENGHGTALESVSRANLR